MRAKIDTANKTLTIQYEDDIDLLILWSHFNIRYSNMLTSAAEANLTQEKADALIARTKQFFGGAYPIWSEIDDALIASGTIVTPFRPTIFKLNA